MTETERLVSTVVRTEEEAYERAIRPRSLADYIGQSSVKPLMDARVPLTDLRIRPPNLEDLFLELTGKELRA